MYTQLLSVLLYVLFLSGTTFADDDDLSSIDLDELKSKLPDNLLPENFLPSSLQNTTLPSLNDTKTVIRDKCIRASGSDAAYEEAEEASGELKICLESIVNVTQLQEEIKEAEPTGDLDTVFNKYCKRRQMAIDCMNNFTSSIDHCLEEDERASRDIFVNIFTGLLNFVCHKDGDQIALFIAEKGPECFQDKADAIRDCANSTFGSYIPTEAPSLTNLPKFTFGTKECNDMTILQKCIVHELEQCQESTPANLVEAMFKFIRNETPCANNTNKAEPRVNTSKNASNFQQASIFVVLGTMWVTLVARTLAY